VPGVSDARSDAGFRLRRLVKPEEFRQAEELQRAVLGETAGLTLPAAPLRSLQDNGGLVVGAFAEIYLAGCAISTIGWDGTTLYHYSHLTVVRPEYQSHHVGLRLKSFQRDEVLGLGLGEIRWTFDPLFGRAAGLAVGRLGARPDRYLPHYFGRLGNAGDPDPESDRLHVRWALASPDVERRLGNGPPGAAARLDRWRASKHVVETEIGETGLRVPTGVDEPAGPSASLEVPYDLTSVRSHEPGSMRRWRHAVRDAFRAAFDLGYSVDDFAVLPLAHERRAFYLLSPPSPNGPASPQPSGEPGGKGLSKPVPSH
jgi:chorismate synthase